MPQRSMINDVHIIFHTIMVQCLALKENAMEPV